MLMLSLNVGEGRYALDGRRVVEVVPQVLCEEIPQSPQFILGRMNYRGSPIPVLDLCQLIHARGCKPSLHTRIIVCSQDGSGETPFMGVLAERVTTTLKAELDEFLDLTMQPDSVAFLGGILHRPDGAVQWIELVTLYDFVGKAFKGVAEDKG